ncbi:MAG: [Fe-S]-binding protein [Deltaproteobacteria bacterium GWA2_57_13]|nr:MAG: [Fe-S]-binding protein [Deltaproteobacteria bacterium GWA2_57_13]
MTTESPEINQETTDKLELKLTEKAIAQVKAILARENLEGYGLRVSVVAGGCSGFSYGLDFEKDERPGDLVLEMNGLKAYLDPSAAKYLKGTVIDYVSGLNGAGFKFTNPNVTATCGCGTSFSA